MELEIDLAIVPLPADKLKAKFEDQSHLGFGKHFADRMLLAEWHAGKGWCDARIKPYEPFVLDPSCMVFHYGQEIFEGLNLQVG